jgi:hypothetical protein
VLTPVIGARRQQQLVWPAGQKFGCIILKKLKLPNFIQIYKGQKKEQMYQKYIFLLCGYSQLN